MKHINGIDEKTANELKGIKPQYRELSDEEILNLFKPKYDVEIDDDMLIDFARAILRKASDK